MVTVEYEKEEVGVPKIRRKVLYIIYRKKNVQKERSILTQHLNLIIAQKRQASLTGLVTNGMNFI